MVWFAANPFPESAWSAAARDLARQPLDHLSKTWRRRISLPGPDLKNVEAECREVLRATKDRQANLSDIQNEAVDAYAAIDKVQQLIGPLVPQKLPPATADLLQATLWDAVPVTFAFKEQFNRGRPYHCCDLPLDPMFQRPSPLYPGHPSYPSSHSTQAYLVAELYARMVPRLRPGLMQAAQGVARRREIAGLHFASDSAAGAMLAGQLVDEFLRVPELLALFNQARGEWPNLLDTAA
jgi:hypothetical protein